MEKLRENQMFFLPSISYDLFPASRRKQWWEVLEKIDQISEIRMRINQPLFIYLKGNEFYLTNDGKLTHNYLNGRKTDSMEIGELLEYWCQSSRYAYEEQIKRGYLTLRMGHRAGLCGETVLQRGEVVTLKYISSINLRIAHQVKNIANPILPYLYEKSRVKNLLIISPPGCGKTTFLRDIVRLISEGNEWGCGSTVSVIDERKELAACYQGVPQLEVGRRTDVMDGCPKKEGMERVLRSMSPKVIAMDELADEDEFRMVRRMVGSGSSVIATVHADSYMSWKQKEKMNAYKNQGIFEVVAELFREKGDFKLRIYEEGSTTPCCTF